VTVKCLKHGSNLIGFEDLNFTFINFWWRDDTCNIARNQLSLNGTGQGLVQQAVRVTHSAG
jgi:hypothetical protein